MTQGVQWARGARDALARRGIAAALAVSFLVAVIAAGSGAALSWDGAALLQTALDEQHVSLPHGRFTVAVFQAPVIWLSERISSMRALEVVYGLSYTLVPAVSAALSWHLLRGHRPRLIVWQLAWSGAGVVAGQLFYVSDCLIALHLSWPLFFALAVGPSFGRAALAGVLGTAIFGLHPVAGPVFGLVGCVCLFLATKERDGRWPRLVAGAALPVAGAVRTLMALSDPYESNQGVHSLKQIWQSLHLPSSGVAALAVAIAAVAVTQLAGADARRAALGAGAGALLAAAVALVPWARDETAWRDALNYRFIAPFAFAPFALGATASLASRDAVLDALLDAIDAALALGNALLVAAVIIVQSAGWLTLRHALESELARRPGRCLPMWAIPECSDTALKWWPTPAYVLILPRAALARPPGKRLRARRLRDGDPAESLADPATRARLVRPAPRRPEPGELISDRRSGSLLRGGQSPVRGRPGLPNRRPFCENGSHDARLPSRSIGPRRLPLPRRGRLRQLGPGAREGRNSGRVRVGIPALR